MNEYKSLQPISFFNIDEWNYIKTTKCTIVAQSANVMSFNVPINGTNTYSCNIDTIVFYAHS